MTLTINGGGVNSYILWMTNRLREMHRLLKPSGSLFVHLDYKSVHYIKVELDKIFGQGSPDRGLKHLINEIIWSYRTGGNNPKKHLGKKHDTILWYSKNKNSYTYNQPEKEKIRQHRRYGHKTIVEYQDDMGWYRLGSPRDVWNIQPDVGQTNGYNTKNKNRSGYSTEKPIILLNKIICMASNEGDIIADFFCGCGTTISSAHGLNRRWLGVDANKKASQVIRKRMARDHQMKIEIMPLKSLTKEQILRLSPFEFEKYCVRSIGGIPNDIQIRDGGIDGYLIEDGTPIQVKKTSNVGRPIIDSFHKHLQKNGKGIIIAKSFGRGAKEEVARLKLKEGYDVTLITIDDILRDAA